MAMASGTDPLDRLQAGARDLRAEREQCHAAADRACRTETGAAFSTEGSVHRPCRGGVWLRAVYRAIRRGMLAG